MIITDINDLSQIDLANVTLSQLRYKVGTYHCARKGVSGRIGVQTDIGDVLDSVWYKAVEHVALRDYESWLVDALEAWEKKLPYISGGEARKKALELYSMRILDDRLWVGYIPFNRSNRPGVIADERLLTVITECCKQPGEITREQYQNGSTFCPVCGRIAEVTVLNNNNEE